MAYVCECACNNHHQQQPQPIPHPCGFFSWPRRIIIAARQVERTACRARASSKAIAVTRYIHHISLAHHPHRLACWWAPRLYKPRCIETLYFSLTLSHFGEPCARILYAYRALCVCVSLFVFLQVLRKTKKSRANAHFAFNQRRQPATATTQSV